MNISDDNVILRVIAKGNERFNKSVDDATKKVRGLGGAFDDVKQKLEQDFNNKQLIELQKELDNVSKELEILKAKQIEASKAQSAAEKAGKSLRGEIKQQIKDYEFLGFKLGDIIERLGAKRAALLSTIKGVTGFSGALKVLRVAIIGTGIGALILAITAIGAALSKSEKVTKFFSNAMTAVGATVGVVVDRFVNLGNALLNFDLGGVLSSFTGVTKEISEASKQAILLKDSLKALEDEKLIFSIDSASAENEIKRLRDLAADESKSTKERIDLLKQAQQIELQDQRQRVLLSRENLLLKIEEQKQNKNSQDSTEALAAATIETTEQVGRLQELQRQGAIEIEQLENAAIDAAKKRAEELEKIYIAAQRNIKDLQNALIVDDEERQIETARTAAARRVEALTGTPQQIEQQTALINEALRRELVKIRKDAVEEVESLDSLPLSSILFKDTQEKENRINFIKELQAIGTLTESETKRLNNELLKLETELQIRRLEIKKASATGDEREQIEQQINLLRRNLTSIQIPVTFEIPAGENSKLQKQVNEVLAGINSLSKGATDLINSFSEPIDLSKIDGEISDSLEKISVLQNSTIEGSRELESVEIERLAKLSKEKERQQKNEIARQKALAVATGISSVATSIQAVVSAFTTSSTPTALIKVGAILSSLATVVATVKSLSSFHTGIERVGDGLGNPNHNTRLKSFETLAVLDKEERVVNRHDNKQLLKWGVMNKDLVSLVGLGLGKMSLPQYQINKNALQPSNDSRQVSELRSLKNELGKKLESVDKRLKFMEFGLNIDSEGFTRYQRKLIDKQEKRRTIR